MIRKDCILQRKRSFTDMAQKQWRGPLNQLLGARGSWWYGFKTSTQRTYNTTKERVSFLGSWASKSLKDRYEKTNIPSEKGLPCH